MIRIVPYVTGGKACMIVQNVTSASASGTVPGGIGRSTASVDSLGSLFDRTDDDDSFLPSIFSNSAFSGLYTENGTLASTSFSTASAFSTSGSSLTASAFSAYQQTEAGNSLFGSSFLSSLADNALDIFA